MSIAFVRESALEVSLDKSFEKWYVLTMSRELPEKQTMELNYTYWKDDGWYVGHLDEYPDYNTQGETLEEFEDMLRSLHEDIKTYDFPFVLHHGTLKIA